VSVLCELDRSRAEAAAAPLGIEDIVADFEQVLDRVDAVVIGTPMHLHVPQSVLALEAGKHVLSEVTAAVSLEQCDQLARAARASRATYMFAENYCYFSENILIRELVRKGMFGEPYYGEGEYLHEVRNYHHTPDGGLTWRAQWQVGQRGCTYGTHSLGPVMQWMKAYDPSDRIVAVSCMGTQSRTDKEHPHDDTSIMLCQLASGGLIKIRVDMMSNRPHQVYYALQGTHGVYESGRAGAPQQVWFGESKAGDARSWRPLGDFESELPVAARHDIEAAKGSGHGGGDFLVGRAFARSLIEGTPPEIDVFDALEWTAAGLCSQQSILQGGIPVPVPDYRADT
jgi:predicted dehydrogenase